MCKTLPKKFNENCLYFARYVESRSLVRDKNVIFYMHSETEYISNFAFSQRPIDSTKISEHI